MKLKETKDKFVITLSYEEVERLRNLVALSEMNWEEFKMFFGSKATMASRSAHIMFKDELIGLLDEAVDG